MIKQEDHLCPAYYLDFKEKVCANCDFINEFVDERGWIYFVRSGIGENAYKTFYKKPDGKVKGCSMVEWKETFCEAQMELNNLAKKKKWRIYENKQHTEEGEQD